MRAPAIRVLRIRNANAIGPWPPPPLTSIHMDGPGQFYITGPMPSSSDMALLDAWVPKW